MEEYKWIEVRVAHLDLSEKYRLDLRQEKRLSTDDMSQELLDSRLADLLASHRGVFIPQCERVVTS